MRKIICDFYAFLAHPFTHIVFGFLVIMLAWCFAYEMDYQLDVYSFIVGLIASAGFSCFDLGIQKLMIRCEQRK